MEGYTRAVTQISAQALHNNLALLRKKAAPARVLAILKANAYGHGLVRVARILQKTADGFGIACLAEALQLRKAGINNKIVVLEGAFCQEDYQIASQFQLAMVIHDEYQYHWLLQHPTIQPIQIWLKINTGMNRLGITPQKADYLIKQLQSLSTVQSIVMMSHLVHAEEIDQVTTGHQRHLLADVFNTQRDAQLSVSLVNSAGLLASTAHYDWVRPGLALYGVSPFKEKQDCFSNFHPVMTLKAKIIAIRNLNAKERIGYYGRYQCKEPTRIGVVSIGYGDGYPYNAPDGTPVLFQTKTVPLVGQVSMDMLTIDISHCLDAKVSDVVTLWGEGLPIEKVAHYTKRSPYELLCGIQRGAHSRLQVDVV